VESSGSSEQTSSRKVHRTGRIGWLRAAVLGANDGLISTGSLVVGVAAADPAQGAVFIAALAGLVAGAISMAAGEYVSVSSQSDTERADLALERTELDTMPEIEHDELTGIYVARGVSPELAAQVARELAEHDALGAHALDELGIHTATRARPIQAALASAAAFTVGAAPPVLLTAFWPFDTLIAVVMGSTLFLLTILGATAARLGGAPLATGAFRVTLWGVVAMAATTFVGWFFGAVG
jgi:VIT1/CCC1 family predicted Fe2+/Mn2+ transporter